MIIHQAYRFKLKTPPAIERFLLTMAGHARLVWNKALWLNLERLRYGVPIIWYADLCGLLRLWKQSEKFGFLAEAHSQVLPQKLRDLDRAFSDAFDRSHPNKRLPRFKKKGVGDSFRFPQGVKVENRRVYLPKIGWVGFFKSREIPGTIKQATITREGDGWYVSIQTEQEVPEPAPASREPLGIDLGVAAFAATSEGELVPPLEPLKRALKKLARLQRKLARQKKGSRNRRKTMARIAQLHQRIARMRADFLHKLSTRWSKSHALIVVENLKIGNLTLSAKGTVENPGTNVAAKSGLNRAILDQGWGQLLSLLEYKLAWRGGYLLKVPAAHTSQTCSACGHVAAANRPDRDTFRCEACGYTYHADLNAAKNILVRGLGRIAA